MREMMKTVQPVRYPDRDSLIEEVCRSGSRPEEDALFMVGRFPAFRALDRVKLLFRYPTVDQLLQLSQREVETVIGRPLRRTEWNAKELRRTIKIDRRWRDAGTDHFVRWIGDAGYPQRLRRVYDAPAVLYGWGCPAVLQLSASSVAVVGTRRPDEAGRLAAYRLGRDLAEWGVPVVSGLARGIDGAAHRGTLVGRSTVSGQAIAVLGSGIDDVYPREHRPLAQDLLRRGGLLLSEYPVGFAPTKFRFPARNRIIAGLSDAVVVVQAPEGSGALITADFAGDIGVEVCVHRAGTGWTGCAALTGGGAETVESGEDVLNLLGSQWKPRDGWVERRRGPELDQMPVHGEGPKSALAAFGPMTDGESVIASREEFRLIGTVAGRGTAQ
ncbi:MAG: DNA-processing protein DprA [Alkalispirochaeta sp.]